MNKVIKAVMIIVFLCYYVQCNSQNNVKEILTKVESTYNANNELLLNLEYKLFTSYSSKIVSESYKGLVVKNNTNTYLKIHNTEFLQTPTRGVKVNHDQKMILVFNKSKMDFSVNPLNLSSVLKNYKKQDLIDKNDYWICSLETGNYTQMLYGKIDIYVNKKTYQIEKQVFYILEKAAYKDPKGAEKFDFPRLEINFKKSNLSNLILREIFNLNNYIHINGTKIEPSKKYSNYTLQNI